MAKIRFKKMNKKQRIISIIAGGLALVTTITGVVHIAKNTNKDNKETKPKATSSMVTLEDIGVELEMPKEDEIVIKTGETTGKVDKNKVVEKDGVVYVDKENADKSDKVGDVKTDTKNDTLEVKPDGTVVEKEEGYEIVDKETGNVIESGKVEENGIPDGFEENEELGGTYEEEDNTEDYVIADNNYYAEDGTLMVQKGDIISKEDLEYAKKHFTTQAPQKSTSSTTSSYTSSVESTTSSKETTSSVSSTISSKKETASSVSSTTSSKETTSNISSTTTETTNIEEGVLNPDGTYSIFGLTFITKADFEQWIIQGYTGYIEVDGIMISEEVLLEVEYTK